MKSSAVLSAVTIFVFAMLLGSSTQAQTSAPPSKVEVGIQFSSLSYPQPSTAGFGATLSPGYANNEAGFGGRFTFNLNRHVALEAEGTFFPHSNFGDPATSGKLLQAQFGVKAGKRFSKFGLFGKARPGIASFSDAFEQVGIANGSDVSGQPYTFPIYGSRRRTNFSMDLGGVLEFYPSRKVLTRLDVGDTIIRHHLELFFPLVAGLPKPSRTTHNLQISAGIGFRFGSLQPESATSQVQQDKPHRFEVGAQFSSLLLRQVEHFASLGFVASDFRDTSALAGVGGRFTFNLNANVALEVQSDFYPKTLRVINNGRVGGNVLQGQAGIKAGKRFERFGIFAKARPGVISFSQAIRFDGFDPSFGFGFPIFNRVRKNYFSLDLGGVLEFYPSRRLVTRFDGGDTLIRYRQFDYPIVFLPPIQFFHTPAEFTHNFQFSAGVGWRF